MGRRHVAVLNRMVGVSRQRRCSWSKGGRKCGSEAGRALLTGCGTAVEQGQSLAGRPALASPTHVNSAWEAEYGQASHGLSSDPHSSRSSSVLSFFNRGGNWHREIK